ncbi:hypothetical protein [Streptomyces sp. NPDC001594]|uniref:hypothetical protein n=1 Tax=Streptomyces sp. NPDC001594 TaxID=3364590 RepID=UPI0036776870
MPIKPIAPPALQASSFGEKSGYIDPKSGLKDRRDKEGNQYLTFTLIVLALVDDFIGELKRREFEVWVQGEDIKKLQDAFPEGMTSVTSREEARVTVVVADEWYSNYQNEKKEWVHTIGLRASSITLPNKKG